MPDPLKFPDSPRFPTRDLVYMCHPAHKTEIRAMDRAQSTAAIIIAMAILFVFGAYIFVTRTDPTDPYPECWPTYTTQCKVDAARRILTR